MSCPTKYRVIKDGWGNRPNFQHSYGLKMTPDDIDEGNVILDQLVRNAIEEWEEEQRRNGACEDTEEGDHDADSSQTVPDHSPDSASYGQDSSPNYHEEPASDTQYYEDSAAHNDGQYSEDLEPASGTQYYEYEHDTPQYEAEEVHDYEYSANDYVEASYEGASYDAGNDRDDGADYDGGSVEDAGGYDDAGNYDDAGYDDGGYASAGSYGGDDYDYDSDY